MKHFLRRTLIFLFAIWLFLALSPLALQALLSAEDGEDPASSSTPEVADPDGTAPTGTFRIYDESQEKVLTVAEEDFLRSALLCEMSADAPEEALKAQAVAIYTVYSRRRLQNTDEDADFACNTAEHRIYTTEKELSAWFGDEWDRVREKIDAVCADVAGQLLTYEGKPIEASFFAISAGCTQPYENVWPEKSYPYLQAVACPADLLYNNCKSTVSFTADEIRSAFPEITFAGEPETWFADIALYDTGYVESVSLCGTELTGVQVREALSLRSAAFTVSYSEDALTFTTLGWGHGVGMSQAGAIYMAENGAAYADILACFYPGTALE